MLSQKKVSLASKLHFSDWLLLTYKVSKRHACRILGFSKTTKKYLPKSSREKELRVKIHMLSLRFLRYWYRKIHDKLKDEEKTVAGPKYDSAEQGRISLLFMEL